VRPLVRERSRLDNAPLVCSSSSVVYSERARLRYDLADETRRSACALILSPLAAMLSDRAHRVLMQVLIVKFGAMKGIGLACVRLELAAVRSACHSLGPVGIVGVYKLQLSYDVRRRSAHHRPSA
jgi:hypothetical protein